MNTVIFDIEGVITYPGFIEKVIQPLQETDKKIMFWTRIPQEAGKKRLREAGLGAFATNNLCLGTDVLFDIQSDSKAFALGEENNLVTSMSRIGLPTNDVELKRVINASKKWGDAMGKIGYSVKFPPLLGDDPYLLVESDGTYLANWYEDTPLKRGKGPEADKQTARENGYSVVLLPEHPEVWQNKGTDVPPETVLATLQQILITWDGKPLIKDLGTELKVYDEVKNMYVEGRNYRERL